MVRQLAVGVSSNPPPGYGPPMETRPPQTFHRTKHVQDDDFDIKMDSSGHTTSTSPAMSAHSSQDMNTSNYTTARPTSESVDPYAWKKMFHRGSPSEVGLEGREDTFVSDKSPRQEVASQAYPATRDSPTTRGFLPPRYGRRKYVDYSAENLNFPVEDNDGSGTYVDGSEKARRVPQKPSKSARHVAKEDRDDETEDDQASYQESKDDDASEEDEEGEIDGRSSTSSVSTIVEVRQPRLPIRRKYVTTINRGSESESPYEGYSTRKHRIKKSSKKPKRSKRKPKKTKTKSKAKKSHKRKQPSPTPSNISTISLNSIRSITPPRNTITTKLCHPVAFNHQDATTPCSLCDPEFALLGHGLRTATVHDQGHDAGMEEVPRSNLPTTKVCVPCTASRMRVLICRKHVLQAINDTSITSTQFGDAFQRVLDKQPLRTDVWCSVCPAPALYKCVGSGVMKGEADCGLRLCELCAVELHEGAKGVLEEFLRGVGEGGEERPLGIRADTELLRLNGALAGFMIRMAGEDLDE